VRISPDQRKSVYNLFQKKYKIVTGSNFRWEIGERKRVIAIFTKISEALGLRDGEHFPKVFEIYSDYLLSHIKSWSCWSNATRKNLLGFLDKVENINIFINKSLNVHREIDIAGTGGKDEWEFGLF
jgi:hypothetical protein